MGLFDKLLKKEQTIVEATEKNTLYLPTDGEIIPLEEIADGVFSEGILGRGCGIRPSNEIVYAPANGTITTIADTKHAIGLMSEDGIEVLIHVGIDTVDMKSDGFEVFVKPDQKVKCGQPLIKFDIRKIKAKRHPTTTAFVVTNSDNFSEVTVLNYGTVSKLTAVIRAK